MNILRLPAPRSLEIKSIYFLEVVSCAGASSTSVPVAAGTNADVTVISNGHADTESDADIRVTTGEADTRHPKQDQ